MSAPPLPRLLAAVALGGAVGAVARWTLLQLTPAETGFPWTTFSINVLGSLLLASLPALTAVRRSPTLAAALGPGVLGGFTTLSATSEQARALLDAGRTGLAASYLLATLGAAVLAAALVGQRARPAAREGRR